jgi:hypothetical protein
MAINLLYNLTSNIIISLLCLAYFLISWYQIEQCYSRILHNKNIFNNRQIYIVDDETLKGIPVSVKSSNCWVYHSSLIDKFRQSIRCTKVFTMKILPWRVFYNSSPAHGKKTASIQEVYNHLIIYLLNSFIVLFVISTFTFYIRPIYR